jgi:hypothetical protein
MNVRTRFRSSTRDLMWLATAVVLALGWYMHWSSWDTQYDEFLKEHVEMLTEQGLAAKAGISEMKERAAEMTDLQRRYEEEVKNNAEFKADFDSRLKRAVENVRRIHAEQAEALARKKAQAEAAAASNGTND